MATKPIGSQTQLRLARIYASRQHVNVDFSRGLNNVSDPTAVGPKECAVLDNLEPDGSGGLIQRPTWTYTPANIGGGVFPRNFGDILGVYARGDGVTFLVVIVGNPDVGSAYLYNPLDQTLTSLTFAGASGCAQYQNRLYLCSRTGAGGWYGETVPNSGTYTFHSLASGATPMPKGDQIIAYKDRLWIAGYGNSDEFTKVYLSDITNTVGGDINNWPVLNFFYVGRGDGQRISKLWAGPNDLFILKQTSTWYFHYESDPTTGALSLMNATVGADDRRSASVYQGSLFSLSNANLYQLVGFQWYRRNDPNRVALDPKTTGAFNFTRGVSTFGDRIIVFNNGGLYVYYPITQTWSTWSETANHGLPHYSMTWFPQSGSAGVNVIYGVNSTPYVVGGGVFGLSSMTEVVPPTNASEVITTTLQTGSQDFGGNAAFKVIYWWAADMIATNTVTGKMYALTSRSIVVTWDEMTTFTWDQLTTGTWDNPTGNFQHFYQSTGMNPTSVPYRMFYRFSRKQRFYRLYLSLTATSDGSQSSGPIRIFGINTYVDLREQLPAGVN